MEGKWRWGLVTSIAPVVWGATYVITQQYLPAESPLWGSVLRALPAGLVLLAVTRTRPRGSWWWKSAILGTLNVGAFFVLVYIAAQRLPSSIAATLMAMSAGAMMLLAWPLLPGIGHLDPPRAGPSVVLRGQVGHLIPCPQVAEVHPLQL